MKRRFYLQAELELDHDEWVNCYGAPLNEEQVKFWSMVLLTGGALRHDVSVKIVLELEPKK